MKNLDKRRNFNFYIHFMSFMGVYLELNENQLVFLPWQRPLLDCLNANFRINLLYEYDIWYIAGFFVMFYTHQQTSLTFTKYIHSKRDIWSEYSIQSWIHNMIYLRERERESFFSPASLILEKGIPSEQKIVNWD